MGFQASGIFVGQHRNIHVEPDSKYIYQVAQRVIVKAAFKDDMIKFQYPISSGDLLELENQAWLKVLEGIKLGMKYKDEENEPELITYDDDLHNLSEFLDSNTTIILFAELAYD